MTLLFTIASGILGIVIGSFLSVLIYRLQHSMSHSWTSRSVCTNCKKTLRPYDLIPLVSYLVLRGKCRDCKGPISLYYPLIELFTGTLFALIYLKYPFITENMGFLGRNASLYAVHIYFMSVLSFSFFYDLKYMLVSDRVLVPAILIALIATLLPGTIHIADALIGASIAFIFFSLQIIISKGKWLGGGDVRVGVLIGIILGWQLTLVALFMAYIVGAITAIITLALSKKTSKAKIPFVPFLVIGTVTALFLGEELINWYLHGFNV